MSAILMALHRELVAAGIPILGESIARVDAAGLLAKWQAAGQAIDFGETFGIEDEGVARILDSRHAAEITENIKRYAAMAADPDTRPWDKKRWRVDFAEGATDEQKALAAKVIADFDPDTVRQPVMRSLAVALGRISQLEFSILRQARAESAEIDLFYELASLQPGGFIDMGGEKAQAGMAALIKAGVFDRARLNQLFDL